MKLTTRKKVFLALLGICLQWQVKAQSVNVSPASQCVSASGNTVTAAISSTVAGATSYSWNIAGPPSCTASYTLTAVNGSACVVTLPCVGNYTITCLAMNGSSVIVAPGGAAQVFALPSLTVTPSQTLCAGVVATLVASGATAYAWSNGIASNSNAVTPTISTCYSVSGTNVNGCVNTTVTCITIQFLPAVNILPNTSQTICLGSSVTFTGTGAATYTWSPNTNVGSTLNVIPTTSTTYTLAGTSGTNNCIGRDTIAVYVNTACAIVWPGDANRDGVVNNIDVFELGLASGSTGPARSGANITWNGQNATAWTGTVSTGWNKCHADCNGDGTINSSDNLAISTNYSLTHSFKSSGASAVNPDIQVVAAGPIVNAGLWNKVDVVVGASASPVNALYGVAFDVNYDQSMVQTDSVKMIYPSSFLNTSNQNINFQKAYYANGKTYCATVRTNGANVNGFGTIAEFWFKVKNGLPSNSVMNISVGNAQKVSQSGVLGALQSAAATTLSVNNNPAGLANTVVLSNTTRVYPNPAKNNLRLENDLGIRTNYELQDVTGRLIADGEFTYSKNLDVSWLNAGTYFIQFKSAQGFFSKKLIITE